MRRRRIAFLIALCVLLIAAIASSRPGGGHTYGGGSSSSSGSSGGGSDDAAGAIFELLFWIAIEHPTIGVPLLIVVGVGYFFFRMRDSMSGSGYSTQSAALRDRMERAGREHDRGRLRSEHQSRLRAALEGLTRIDPAFSVIVFEDFVHALFSEAHVARGAGTLDRLAPWLLPAAREQLARITNGPVHAVVIGAIHYRELHGLDESAARIGVTLEIEANYSEGVPSGVTYWVVERWSLSRAKTAKSRPPKKARVFECPGCGAPLDRVVGARCQYCHQIVDTGDYDWVVTGIVNVARSARAPALTGTTPERGTDAPTVVDSRAEELYQALTERDPSTGFGALEARVRLIFEQLTLAWNAQDLSGARPYVGDLLLDTLGYWVETYRKAGLRNVSRDARIQKLVIARVTTDAHFDAITLRVFATGLDYTLDAGGEVVGGDDSEPRRYSEYWTLIRGVTVRGAPRSEPVCPSCGAPADVNQAGACQHCRAEVTSGDFDWVLTRIEQDEAY